MFETHIATWISQNSVLPYADVLAALVKVNIKTKMKRDIGDYSLCLFKFQRFDPPTLITHFSNLVVQDTETTIAKITVSATNGTLNVYVNKGLVMRSTLLAIQERGDDYFKLNVGQNQRVIIEFSSPNIAKPFHAGHLRSTVLGQFLVNLYRSAGYSVIAMNYLGNWGKQFGILGYGLQRRGLTLEDLKHTPDPIKTLTEIYIEMNALIKTEKRAHLNTLGMSEDVAKNNNIQIVSETDQYAKQFFTDLENGDADKFAIWKFIQDVSLKVYQDLYTKLGVHFDVYCGESDYRNGSLPVQNIIPRLEALPNFQANERSTAINLQGQNLGTLVLMKSDGSSLYSLRDIAAAVDRYQKYQFDEMLYVVASEQEYYFQQLLRVLGQVEPGMHCRHIGFGMVEGMSTRAGNVVLLEEILERSKAEMLKKIQQNEEKKERVENVEETASVLGKSAVFIQDLKAERIKNYEFKWERATDFHGQTGPYLQYSHVRLHNILEKAQTKGLNLDGFGGFALPDFFEVNLAEPEAQELTFLMLDHATTLQTCIQKCEAQPLVTWLFNFVRCVFNAYTTLSVVKCDDINRAHARLLLFSCSKNVIGYSLRLLGLEPLEKM